MTRGSHSMYYCKRCLNGFASSNALYNHKTYCNEQDAVRVVLPKPDTMLSFKNYNRSMRVPFVVYADFESCIKPLDTCQPKTNVFFVGWKQMEKEFC